MQHPISLPAELATLIRRDCLDMIYRAQASHIGACFSVADVLAHLYSGFLNHDPNNPRLENRDRLVFSKGHAAAALYAVLAESGYFDVELLKTYCEDGSLFAGHVSHRVPGVEVSTGSLGHGLPIAVGMAMALARDNSKGRSIAILSDGECNEGSTWEAALMASHHALSNLILIIDVNRLQGLGATSDVLNTEPLAEKWANFGWAVRSIDGNDHEQIATVLSDLPFRVNKPSVILAYTVKGNGVSFMENKLEWHYFSPNEMQYKKAMKELVAKCTGRQ